MLPPSRIGSRPWRWPPWRRSPSRLSAPRACTSSGRSLRQARWPSWAWPPGAAHRPPAAAVLAGIVALAAIVVWPSSARRPGPACWRRRSRASCAHRRTSRASWPSPRSRLSSVSAAGDPAGLARPHPSMATAGLYALAGVVPPLLALVLAYLRVTQFDRSIPFALVAVFLAAAFYLLADRFGRIAPADRTAATGSPSAPSPPASPPPWRWPS